MVVVVLMFFLCAFVVLCSCVRFLCGSLCFVCLLFVLFVSIFCLFCCCFSFRYMFVQLLMITLQILVGVRYLFSTLCSVLWLYDDWATSADQSSTLLLLHANVRPRVTAASGGDLFYVCCVVLMCLCFV